MKEQSDKKNHSIFSLNEITIGKKGVIAAINGGLGLNRKIDMIGIRVGMEIKVVSRQWMKGPVIIRVGNTEVAIGYRMANKILVKNL
jgi:ferrous iron transport protein A